MALWLLIGNNRAGWQFTLRSLVIIWDKTATLTHILAQSAPGWSDSVEQECMYHREFLPIASSVNVEMATWVFSIPGKALVHLHWLIIEDTNIPFISLIKLLINFFRL